ncbi:MAG: hypothetical protein A3I78_04585 [Gammaproteobacteria bacterium RIFCSPLOWO2_02_FULL_56_15]|nr:MAG: hypothetical protein A3I78_04585 [Gammaproteobacteria bacterium RIFCSPLOWO2_02_FULL_56_15]
MFRFQPRLDQRPEILPGRLRRQIAEGVSQRLQLIELPTAGSADLKMLQRVGRDRLPVPQV